MKVGDRADFTEDIQASSGEQEGYVPASLSRSSKAKRGESQLLIRHECFSLLIQRSPVVPVNVEADPCSGVGVVAAES